MPGEDKTPVHSSVRFTIFKDIKNKKEPAKEGQKVNEFENKTEQPKTKPEENEMSLADILNSDKVKDEPFTKPTPEV